jgi:hypothetical protein
MEGGLQIDVVSDIIHDFVHLGLVKDVSALNVTLVYVVLAAHYQLFIAQENVRGIRLLNQESCN